MEYEQLKQKTMYKEITKLLYVKSTNSYLAIQKIYYHEIWYKLKVLGKSL